MTTLQPCAYCGAPIEPGASYCSRCGQPVIAAPALPRRRLPLIPLLGGMAVVGVCLCVVIAASVWLWHSNQIAESGTPGPVTSAPAADNAVEVDEATRQHLEESVGRLEAAFRAGDIEAVMNLTHPAMRDSYMPIFEAHRDELKRVADLLATRRLVAATYAIAEYEVTENGRTFSVTFEPWGETWYLSSL